MTATVLKSSEVKDGRNDNGAFQSIDIDTVGLPNAIGDVSHFISTLRFTNAHEMMPLADAQYFLDAQRNLEELRAQTTRIPGRLWGEQDVRRYQENDLLPQEIAEVCEALLERFRGYVKIACTTNEEHPHSSKNAPSERTTAAGRVFSPKSYSGSPHDSGIVCRIRKDRRELATLPMDRPEWAVGIVVWVLNRYSDAVEHIPAPYRTHPDCKHLFPDAS